MNKLFPNEITRLILEYDSKDIEKSIYNKVIDHLITNKVIHMFKMNIITGIHCEDSYLCYKLSNGDLMYLSFNIITIQKTNKMISLFDKIIMGIGDDKITYIDIFTNNKNYELIPSLLSSP